MKTATLKLIEFIGAQVVLFEKFLKALEKQQEALVSNDIKLLEETTAQLEDLTARTRETEERRKELVQSISTELDLEKDDVNLNHLTELVAAPEADELARLQSTLLGLHQQITECKSRNEFLIRKSMECLDTTISCITGSQNEEATYQSEENKLNRKRKALSLNRRV
ncbi:MAG: flagellar protein FlgN [candidate division Zixibacteria bacterium]|nr:flagellar protein FlgN [candidate division Zixibacteria bacterium]